MSKPKNKENPNSKDLTVLHCFNFYVGGRGAAGLYKNILGHEITPQNFYILECCSMDNERYMGDIAADMMLDSSAVSTLISRMEKKGWVIRTNSLEDRRNVTARLTQEGFNLREKYRPQVELINQHIENTIPSEMLSALSDLQSSMNPVNLAIPAASTS